VSQRAPSESTLHSPGPWAGAGQAAGTAEAARAGRSGARPTRAEIDLAALRHNAALARRLAGPREILAVVKADAYGHGAVPVARALVEAGCARLGVLTVEEAEPLVEAGIGVPLLVMGGVHDAREAARAAALRLTPVVHHAEGLALLAEAAPRAGEPLPVHVEVDTAMHRMGVPAEDAARLLQAVAETPGLRLEGVFTHFARADEPDVEPVLEQCRRFRRVLAEAAAAGLRPPVVHAANSPALLAADRWQDALPEATAVRPGLMLYGIAPAPHLAEAAPLRPVMTLRAPVVQVHEVPAGEAVGYGGEFRPERPARVATLAAGYADGVAWASRGRGRVWLAGAARPVVGRVSMDYTAVLVEDAEVAVGDEAVLLGGRPGAGIPASEVAAAGGTSPYEVPVRVGPRVPRVVV